MADRRARILSNWRTEYAGLLVAHKAAVDAADHGGAQRIRRDMKALERAIKGFTESRMGEFRAGAGRRNQAAARDRN